MDCICNHCFLFTLSKRVWTVLWYEIHMDDISRMFHKATLNYVLQLSQISSSLIHLPNIGQTQFIVPHHKLVEHHVLYRNAATFPATKDEGKKSFEFPTSIFNRCISMYSVHIFVTAIDEQLDAYRRHVGHGDMEPLVKCHRGGHLVKVISVIFDSAVSLRAEPFMLTV